MISHGVNTAIVRSLQRQGDVLAGQGLQDVRHNLLIDTRMRQGLQALKSLKAFADRESLGILYSTL